VQAGRTGIVFWRLRHQAEVSVSYFCVDERDRI